MGTLTINGRRVTVDSSFANLSPEDQQKTVEEIAAQMGASQPQAVPGGTEPIDQQGITPLQGGPGPQRESFGQTHVGQALSGVNEGIASGLGVIPDTINEIIRPVLGAVGVQASDRPFGGTEMWRDVLAPTISDPTDDPGKQMLRRVGKDVGAGAVFGGPLAAMTRAPLAAFGADLVASVGSGAGAAVAEQVAPGNEMAELVGSLAGGFAPTGLAAALRTALSSKTAPTVEALRGMKSAAYKQADSLGVKYTPQAFAQMVADIDGAAAGLNINAMRHPRAASMIADMKDMAAKGYSPTLTELDQLRQVVRRDVANSPDAAESFFGSELLDGIDDFIAGAGRNAVVSGNPTEAAALIASARELNTRWRKSELIAEVIEKARRRADSTGSGGNVANAIRQNIRGILDNPKRARAFSADERAMMEAVVRGGRIENFMRLVGKLSPSGNGLMAALGIGATAANPIMASVPAAGFAAKAMSDAATTGKAARLQAQVQRGAPAPKLSLNETDANAVATTGALAASNDNDGSLVAWLASKGRKDLADAVRSGKMEPAVAYREARQEPIDITVPYR